MLHRSSHRPWNLPPATPAHSPGFAVRTTRGPVINRRGPEKGRAGTTNGWLLGHPPVSVRLVPRPDEPRRGGSLIGWKLPHSPSWRRPDDTPGLALGSAAPPH